MTKPQVIDGRIKHANGYLELKLAGVERAQAHADILAFIDPSGGANGKQVVYNQSIGNILRRDPSLLLEPIPGRYPLSSSTRESWVNADSVWRTYNEWYGNWLTRLLDPAIGCDEAVELALQAGIHPDDETIWPEKTLLASEGWATNPRRLALGLKYKANPDFNGGEWHDGYLRKALNFVRWALSDASREQEMRDGIRCAHLLLDAGAKVLDPPRKPSVLLGQMNLCGKLLTSIGYLTEGRGVLMTKPELRGQIFELAEGLQRAGADIDRTNGKMELPPVVQALRCQNIDFACQLIRMGCKTEFDTGNRSLSSGLETLEHEAYTAGKDFFVARLLEAQMERQIASAAATSASESVIGQAPRRRLRAV